MRMRQRCAPFYIAWVLIVVAITTCLQTSVARAEGSVNNRYNVVLVVDASGSMLEADPKQFRNDVIAHFTGMLTDQGNELGVVVFTDHVVLQKKISAVDSLDDKLKIIESIENVKVDGDTNIGDALITAMDMLDADRDNSLPSVILLITDGKTDLPYATEDLEGSYKSQFNAVQRANKENVRIYPIFLNVNQKQDPIDLERIAEGTQGVMIEIQNIQDISEAYSKLCNKMYGTITHTAEKAVFPQSGKLNTIFTVPNIVTDEMDIAVYGKRIKSLLLDPDGKAINPTTIERSDYRILKVRDAKAGQWRIETEGIPGDNVSIKIALKSNLDLNCEIVPNKDTFSPDDTISIEARFGDNPEHEAMPNRYEGFRAELQVYDAAKKNILYVIPMDTDENGFCLKKAFEEGAYRFEVHVANDYIEQWAALKRAIKVDKKATSEHELNDKPPKPGINTLRFWAISLPPFIKPFFVINLNAIASDEDDSHLNYLIYMEKSELDEFVVDGSKLTLMGLKKHEHKLHIRIQDSANKKCDIDIVVIPVNYTAIIGIIATTLFAFWYYKENTKPSNGTITIKVAGDSNSDPLGRRWKGKLGLKEWNLRLDMNSYRRSYIKATGKDFVQVRMSKKVKGDSGEIKKNWDVSNDVTTLDLDGILVSIEFKSDFNANSLHIENNVNLDKE